MKVREIAEKLELTVYSGHSGLDNEVIGGYVSDLLSDVMGNADEGQAWITLQNHKNIMAVASLKDLAAVILVKGLKPDEATMMHSNEENLPILGTDAETFETAGALFKLLHP
ncbi:DRTGG domain-containing protein [Alkaliflexus imshenetskii]|uniref:DRTGG domain-containing protein n=1 Tax=Alkaliflexus imshenetskii TaxID=286730 RepID=UPI00047E0A16|nr:DRTGG domain-containing protein [Alkaliflexus imshenetskii]